MSVKLNPDSVQIKKKKALIDLADEAGITLSQLFLLKTGEAEGIKFSTLSALCENLGCQPGDILKIIKT